ncbi:MAG: hypothetical protein AAFV26_01720 [Pseudomonadota bacterium]
MLVTAGAMSALAMAPFHVWAVLFATIPVMIVAAMASRPGQPVAQRAVRGFGAGWWFGFGYHLAGLHWIAFPFLVQADVFAWLLPFALALMPAGLALFIGAACAVATLVPARWIAPPITFAIALTASEIARGHVLTGFPWNTFGYALTGQIALAQGLSLAGLYGMTLIALVVAAMPWWCLSRGSSPRAIGLAAATGLAPIGALAAFGLARLQAPQVALVDGVKLRLVQPSIDQRERWRTGRRRG